MLLTTLRMKQLVHHGKDDGSCSSASTLISHGMFVTHLQNQEAAQSQEAQLQRVGATCQTLNGNCRNWTVSQDIARPTLRQSRAADPREKDMCFARALPGVMTELDGPRSLVLTLSHTLPSPFHKNKNLWCPLTKQTQRAIM